MNKKFKRRITAAGVSAMGVGILSPALTVMAAPLTTSWRQSDGVWNYYNSKGVKLTNGWIKTGQYWYYLGADGAMARNSWAKDSSERWFYLEADGAMATNSWAQDSSKCWFYLGDDGAMVTSTWVEYRGNFYYLNSGGNMAVNTTTPDGYVVDESGSRQAVGNNNDLCDGCTHTGNYLITSLGTFGQNVGGKTTTVNGNITINYPNAAAVDVINLNNLTINGKLTVNFGSGSLYLNNVKVTSVDISNIGSHCVYANEGTTIGTMTMNDQNNDGRVVIGSSASIGTAVVHSGATFEVAGGATNANPLGTVTSDPTAPPSPTIMLTFIGAFPNTNLNVLRPSNVNLPAGSSLNSLTANGNLNLTGGGSLGSLTASGTGGFTFNIGLQTLGSIFNNSPGTFYNLPPGTTVGTFNFNANGNIAGGGTITTANIGANGTTIETPPTHTSVLPGISANVGGHVADSSNTPVISSVPTTPPVHPVTPPSVGGNSGSGGSITAANAASVATVKGLVAGATYTMPQAAATNEAAVKSEIERVISGLALDGVTATVTKGDYTPAVAGTEGDPDGTNGSYRFSVTLSKGTAAATTATLTMTVTATAAVLNSTVPATALYDKYTYNTLDIPMTLNGNTLTKINDGLSDLVLGTDYSIAGSTVILNKSYMQSKAIGDVTLAFTFSAGETDTCVITVSNSIQQGDVTFRISGVIGNSEEKDLEGAKIYIDGKVLITGQYGMVSIKLDRQQYTFTVEMEGYQSRQSYLSVGESNTVWIVLDGTKEITGFTALTAVNINDDEHLTDLAALKASGKLPTKVTVTDGATPVEAAITDWTGTFDGTAGPKILTAVWTIPTGYADETNPITVQITANVNMDQTVETPSITSSVASNVVVTDIGNAGNGSDMHVTFNKALDESLVGSEYYVLVTKATALNLATAEAAYSAENYISAGKTGNNISLTLSADSKDTEGVDITNNVPYKVYVLSMADGINATLNALSDDFASITLDGVDLAVANVESVATVKGLVAGATYTMTQADATDEAAVKAEIERVISGLALDGVATTVIKVLYTPAEVGTSATAAGINGTYTFTVLLSKGAGATLAEDTTATLTMIVTATPYAA